MKKSALAVGLEAAAGRPAAATATETAMPSAAVKASSLGVTVMIGAHYPSEVRRALKLLEAETGRRLKPLLAEAINDLCAKYGKPQPCTIED